MYYNNDYSLNRRIVMCSIGLYGDMGVMGYIIRLLFSNKNTENTRAFNHSNYNENGELPYL